MDGSFRRRLKVGLGQAVMFGILVAISVFAVYQMILAQSTVVHDINFVVTTYSSNFLSRESTPIDGRASSPSKPRKSPHSFRKSEATFHRRPLVRKQQKVRKLPPVKPALRIPEESGPAYEKAFQTITTWKPSRGKARRKSATTLGNRTTPWEIIFLRTSSEPLEKFELCALYAAAKHNPKAIVKLLSFESFPLPAFFHEFPNVSSEALNFSSLFNGTPLEDWYEKRLFEGGRNWVSRVRHLANAARHAYVWKHGATYLDTDMLTLKPLDKLRNCLAYQQKENRLNTGKTWKAANGALLSFDQGHPFLELVMNTTRDTFNGSMSEGNYGPKLLTRMLPVYESLREKNNWPPMHVLPSELVYPVLYRTQRVLFKPAGTSLSIESKVEKAFTLHMWRNAQRKKHKNPTLESGTGTLLRQYQRLHCPPLYSSDDEE